jgi:hypothetical protein
MVHTANTNANTIYKPAPREYVHAAQQTKRPFTGTAKRAWTICKAWNAKNNLCRYVLNVAWCESTFQLHANNGQYKGIWQMGSIERRVYGHGRTVYAQTRAARKYWIIAGWQPWECKPKPSML